MSVLAYLSSEGHHKEREAHTATDEELLNMIPMGGSPEATV